MNETISKHFFSINQCLYGDFSFPLFFGVTLLAVLFGLDIATTNMVLLLGGYEQNVLMAVIIDSPIIHLAIKGLVLIFITFVVLFSECKIKGSGLCALFMMICFYSFVIYNNAMVLQDLVQAR